MDIGTGQQFAFALMFLAAALIAVGRMHIRRARRAATVEDRLHQKRLLGWTLVACGGLLMILGAVIW